MVDICVKGGVVDGASTISAAVLGWHSVLPDVDS
jgi:hypothetical protein